MTTTKPDYSELLAAEVDYWRLRADHAEKALSDLATRAEDSRWPTLALPPQPPVGTTLSEAGSVVWTRRDDGWHCAREGCVNCPADWFEVVDQGGLSYERQLP